MTDRLTPTPPEQKAILYAAYRASHDEAEHLGLDVYDDRIVQAAIAVAVPLAQALALREAADEANAWSGAAEWLRERAYRIQAAGENRREAHRSAMRRQREMQQVIVTVLPEETR